MFHFPCKTVGYRGRFLQKGELFFGDGKPKKQEFLNPAGTKYRQGRFGEQLSVIDRTANIEIHISCEKLLPHEFQSLLPLRVSVKFLPKPAIFLLAFRKKTVPSSLHQFSPLGAEPVHLVKASVFHAFM